MKKIIFRPLWILAIPFLTNGCATISKTTEPVVAANKFYQESLPNIGYYALISNLETKESNAIKYAQATYRQQQDNKIIVNKLGNYCVTIGGHPDVQVSKQEQSLIYATSCFKKDKVLFASTLTQYYKYEKDLSKGYSLTMKKEQISYVDFFLAQPKGDIGVGMDMDEMIKNIEVLKTNHN